MKRAVYDDTSDTSLIYDNWFCLKCDDVRDNSRLNLEKLEFNLLSIVVANVLL